VSTAPLGAAPATTPNVAVPKPLRIKTLTLTDFRAFPGPAPQAIEFGGKNLLVYGENGAGKSSIFHALRAVFSDAPQSKRGSLADYKNKFSTPGVGCARVDVAFDGMSELGSWTLGLSAVGAYPAVAGSPIVAEAAIERHPFNAMREPARTAFRRATARAACLDYRALLDTNYRHGNEEINLFSVAVNHLLRDYDYTPPGGQPTTIGSLWDKVDGADKTKAVGANPTSHRPSFIKDCENLNEAIASALLTLQPLVNALIGELGHSDLQVVNLAYGYVGPKAARLKRERGLMGGTLVPNVRYRDHDPARPQDFLNEARLSALALSIYFAGRLTCTPAVTSDVLKLLVLDDVLIGLDHANRLPVLDLLQKHFATWQIVLLTHDRGWFDMARGWLDEDAWQCVEIFEGDASAPAPMPVVRATENYPAKSYLAHAKRLLAEHYVEASANYARQAFEAALRGGCQRKGIPVAFQQSTKDVKAEVLLQAVEDWAKSDHARKLRFEPVLKRLRLLRNVVLNPYSHPLAPNIPTTEVHGAIAEVEKLIDAFIGKP
jgi:energy-coupling factor transporter ATP-binding protein EcfA2